MPNKPDASNALAEPRLAGCNCRSNVVCCAGVRFASVLRIVCPAVGLLDNEPNKDCKPAYVAPRLPPPDGAGAKVLKEDNSCDCVGVTEVKFTASDVAETEAVGLPW